MSKLIADSPNTWDKIYEGHAAVYFNITQPIRANAQDFIHDDLSKYLEGELRKVSYACFCVKDFVNQALVLIESSPAGEL